jgi:hypothetical protein
MLARTSQQALGLGVGVLRVISHDVIICLVTLLPAATDAATTRSRVLLCLLALLLITFFCNTTSGLLAACRTAL